MRGEFLYDIVANIIIVTLKILLKYFLTQA